MNRELERNIMRTGAEYREALRDGRRVWIMGEGLIDDITTHPATRAMVDEYVAWYDRHADPAWAETAFTPRERMPLSFLLPRSADDLTRMGKCFSATTFLSAGNITHTPAYGHLISLGILAAVGGFVDIGDLVFDAAAGATFGYQLLGVVALGAVGIIVYSEMCAWSPALPCWARARCSTRSNRPWSA